MAEYVRHIAPHDPPLTVVPGMAAKKPWNRSSWIAVEFDLLYRWHMLVPDQVTTDEGPVDAKTFLRDNNKLVIDRGLFGDIEKLEWYVGIFAEDHPEDQMMGDL